MAASSGHAEGLNVKTTYVRVIANLQCREADPKALIGRRVYLFDADALTDDFLSASTVEQDGTAGFLFDLTSGRSLDSLFESRPDLYCVVKDNDGRVLYRSEIHENVDFLSVDPASQEQHRTIQIEFPEEAGR
jgi:hypothetical protein